MSTIVVEYDDGILGPVAFTLPDDDAAQRVAYSLATDPRVIDVAMQNCLGEWWEPTGDDWAFSSQEAADRYEQAKSTLRSNNEPSSQALRASVTSPPSPLPLATAGAMAHQVAAGAVTTALVE